MSTLAAHSVGRTAKGGACTGSGGGRGIEAKFSATIPISIAKESFK
jgi:hypothetical protein